MYLYVKLSREFANHSFSTTVSKDCINSIEVIVYRDMSARRGENLYNIPRMTVVYLTTFPAKTDKMLSTRNSSILMMSSSRNLFLERKRRRSDSDLLYDKTPIPTENSKINGQHKNATKNFDYTTIADRIRTVSWSDNSHPTGMVIPVYGYPTFPLTIKAVLSKGHTV